MTGYPDDDDVVEGQIVDDGPADQRFHPGPEPLLNRDDILVPCHHGCNCELHVQVTYASRVPPHDPDILDHGEMGLLVRAAEQATRRGDHYRDFLARHREVTVQARGRARKLLIEFELMLADRGARRPERVELAEQRAALPTERREPAPRWLKATAVGATLAMAAFDAYYFQQAFLNILQIKAGEALWIRGIGLLAALVFAVGVISVGRMLAGPVWLLSVAWRRPGRPDDKPPGRFRLLVHGLLTVIPVAAILYVLGIWAMVRAQGNDPSPPVVMLLLLSLALTVIVLEILVYNPYQAAVTRDRREVRRLLKADREVTDALTVAEIAWRNLRSSQDEVIGFVRAELAWPWHEVILPARLRHGRAGARPALPEYGVEVKIAPGPAAREGAIATDQVQIDYRLFAGVDQPQPSPGPLAETVRSVMELHPGDLQDWHARLQAKFRSLTAEAPETGTPS